MHIRFLLVILLIWKKRLCSEIASKFFCETSARKDLPHRVCGSGGEGETMLPYKRGARNSIFFLSPYGDVLVLHKSIGFHF